MINNTINDAKTIAASDKDASIVRSLRCQYSVNLMFTIRNALRSELSCAHYR